MSSQTHPHPKDATPAEWLEDAAFLALFFVGAIIATILVLMIVL